jgi:proteasome lid subunit RPN8/RPN11
MIISPELLHAVIEHAQENPKIECCGLVAVKPSPDGAKRHAVEVYHAENIHASALKFEIDPLEQLKLTNTIEERGWEIGAIYHSHVRSEPYPSQTDISFAAHLGRVEWIIIGLHGGEPEVRSYLIEDDGVREVPLEVG